MVRQHWRSGRLKGTGAKDSLGLSMAVWGRARRMAAAGMTRQTKGNGDRRVIADQLIHGIHCGRRANMKPRAPRPRQRREDEGEYGSLSSTYTH